MHTEHNQDKLRTVIDVEGELIITARLSPCLNICASTQYTYASGVSLLGSQYYSEREKEGIHETVRGRAA